MLDLKHDFLFILFFFCKLLIKHLTKVVFPTPISPIKNIQSSKSILLAILIEKIV